MVLAINGQGLARPVQLVLIKHITTFFLNLLFFSIAQSEYCPEPVKLPI